MVASNKRLSQDDRGALARLAIRRVDETEPRDGLDAAYEAAADVIHAAVVKNYPQKDMAVLALYDAARADACIYVASLGSRFERFQFRDGDKRIALRPSQNCRNQPVQLETEQQPIYDAYTDASKARETVCKKRAADYLALISNARSFNDVASVWSDAEQLRVKICGNSSSLTVLSDDVIDRLKSDAANTPVLPGAA